MIWSTRSLPCERRYANALREAQHCATRPVSVPACAGSRVLSCAPSHWASASAQCLSVFERACVQARCDACCARLPHGALPVRQPRPWSSGAPSPARTPAQRERRLQLRATSAMTRISARHMKGSADNRELLQCTSIHMRHKVPLRIRIGLIIRRFWRASQLYVRAEDAA